MSGDTREPMFVSLDEADQIVAIYDGATGGGKTARMNALLAALAGVGIPMAALPGLPDVPKVKQMRLPKTSKRHSDVTGFYQRNRGRR